MMGFALLYQSTSLNKKTQGLSKIHCLKENLKML